MSTGRTHDLSEVFGFLLDDTLDCQSTTFSCDDLKPPCNGPITGLIFSNVWTITEKYYKLCDGLGGWLSPSTTGLPNAALSVEAADVIIGKKFTAYPEADVWSRLTTWKFPLFQLIATMPRPPLGFFIELLTVVHLISDPIGSMEVLLYKLEGCKGRLDSWKKRVEAHDIFANVALSDEEKKMRPQWIKSLTIIAESYNELGGDIHKKADDALLSKFHTEAIATGEQQRRQQEHELQKLLKECLTTAGALAADRATTLLPVAAAEVLFIAVFIINLTRLKLGEESRVLGTTHVNIEVHSIAFSVLFFWLVPTVAVAAVIGTSQTEKAIPRILMRFKRDLGNEKVAMYSELPELSLKKEKEERTTFDPGRLLGLDDSRWLYSIYSWQPDRKKPEWYAFLPALVLISSLITGISMSYYVPPSGWRCRTWGETYFAIVWFGSYLLSYAIAWLPELTWYSRKFTCNGKLSYGGHFLLMLLKDLAVTVFIAWWIYLTQIGYYNKFECYHGRNTGLVMPEQQDAFDDLQEGLRVGGTFVTTLAIGISVQAGLVPTFLCARYWATGRAFMQKDDMIDDLSTGVVMQEQQGKQESSSHSPELEPALSRRPSASFSDPSDSQFKFVPRPNERTNTNTLESQLRESERSESSVR